MHRISRREILVGAALATSSTLSGTPAWAQAYPDRALKLLVPLGAGSAVDVVVRLVAEKMAELLGQPIVVENQAGAAGLIGMRAGARAKPDGYTFLGVNDSVMTMLPNMHQEPGYDPLKDFIPITQLVFVNWALVAHPSAGISTVSELIAKAKAAPDTLTFASGGIGSPQHVAMEIFMKAAGVKLSHVPYKGAAQGLNDIVGGQVAVGFIGLPTPNAFIKSGQLKLLGQGSKQRLAMLPDHPTVGETVKDFTFYSSGNLVAPAGTPPAVIAKLSAAASAALATPAVKDKLTGLGYEIVANSPETFATELKADYARMGDIIRAAGIKVEP